MERRKRKPVFGVGINDADYNVQVRDKDRKLIFSCVAYNKWYDMLKRCYSTKIEKRPTYLGCSVCEDWLTFSKFKSWLELQEDWEHKSLDKDILAEGNKIYSPSTCLMVNKEVNSSLVLRGRDRGDLPVGVHNHNGKFVARCQDGKKRNWLGTFNTSEEAHKVWQLAKIQRFKYLQSQQTCERTKQGLQRIIDKLQYHIDNNIETKDL